MTPNEQGNLILQLRQKIAPAKHHWIAGKRLLQTQLCRRHPGSPRSQRAYRIISSLDRHPPLHSDRVSLFAINLLGDLLRQTGAADGSCPAEWCSSTVEKPLASAPSTSR